MGNVLSLSGGTPGTPGTSHMARSYQGGLFVFVRGHPLVSVVALCCTSAVGGRTVVSNVRLDCLGLPRDSTSPIP